MSAKVCLPAWNGGTQKTRDAITLGQLEQMIRSLYGLGFDLDTPVTYLFDEDHVWLETVEWDAEEVFSKVVVARIAEELGKDERDAEWIDCDGERWAYRGDRWAYSGDMEQGPWHSNFEPTQDWGPYVEFVR